MTKKLIRELRPLEKVELQAYVSRSELRSTRKGKSFLSVTLSDCSGAVDAVYWEIEPTFKDCFKGRFVYVTGEARSYEEKIQLTLSQLPHSIPTPDSSAMKDFIHCSPFPLEQLLQRLNDHIASVRDPSLKALLESIFEKDSNFMDSFTAYPAALVYHHAFRHGLLHHTLEVTDFAAGLADTILSKGTLPISKDLIVAGALLHDIGKCDELKTNDFHFDMTDEGCLLGHIQIGISLIAAKKDRLASSNVRFKPETLNALKHILLSHHGKSEWGSVAAPAFQEAEIIHQSDLLSAKLHSFEEAKELAPADSTHFRHWKLESASGEKGRTVYLGDLGVERSCNTPIKLILTNEIAEESLEYRSIPNERNLPVWRIVRYLDANDRERSADRGLKRLTIYGQIAAGAGMLDSDCIEGDAMLETEEGSTGFGQFFLLRVQGDSMTGDGIQDEDLIVVQSQSEVVHGDLAAVILEDEGAVVKRFTMSGKSVTLRSSNPKYSPIPVPDLNALKVQGKVVGIAKADLSRP